MLALMWVLSASAGPFQMLVPASTVHRDQTIMGASVGYSAPTNAFDQGVGAIGAWARYGAAERLEVGGGAVLPFSPVTLGLYGGARVQLLDAGPTPGPKASVGVLAGTALDAARYPAVAAPFAVGFRTDDVELFVQPSGTLQSSAGGALLGWSAELGVAVFSAGFPIYLTASYGQLAGVGVAGANVGGAYDLAL